MAVTFAEIRDRAKYTGNDAGVSFAMAMFYNDPAVIYIHSDELRRAIYVWSRLDMLEVTTMKRQALVNMYQTIWKTTPWPNVRKTISWKPRDRRRITMELDDLDIDTL
jgi:hypothetical protein